MYDIVVEEKLLKLKADNEALVERVDKLEKAPKLEATQDIQTIKTALSHLYFHLGEQTYDALNDFKGVMRKVLKEGVWK